MADGLAHRYATFLCSWDVGQLTTDGLWLLWFPKEVAYGLLPLAWYFQVRVGSPCSWASETSEWKIL